MVAYTRILNLFWLLDFFSQNISANIPSPPLPPPKKRNKTKPKKPNNQPTKKTHKTKANKNTTLQADLIPLPLVQPSKRLTMAGTAQILTLK